LVSALAKEAFSVGLALDIAPRRAIYAEDEGFPSQRAVEAVRRRIWECLPFLHRRKRDLFVSGFLVFCVKSIAYKAYQ
jgi:hypothetical protein